MEWVWNWKSPESHPASAVAVPYTKQSGKQGLGGIKVSFTWQLIIRREKRRKRERRGRQRKKERKNERRTAAVAVNYFRSCHVAFRTLQNAWYHEQQQNKKGWLYQPSRILQRWGFPQWPSTSTAIFANISLLDSMAIGAIGTIWCNKSKIRPNSTQPSQSSPVQCSSSAGLVLHGVWRVGLQCSTVRCSAVRCGAQ